MAFRFHDNHREDVVLSNDQQTAEHRKSVLGGGIVMSRDHMEINKLYEVQITKTDKGPELPLWAGVVTSSPESLIVPEVAWRWESAVFVFSDGVSDHLGSTFAKIGQALIDLPTDSRVGVSIDHDRRLHLHVNGIDQGVVPYRMLPDECLHLHVNGMDQGKVKSRKLPDECWAMWELCGPCREITSLPVTDAVFTTLAHS